MQRVKPNFTHFLGKRVCFKSLVLLKAGFAPRLFYSLDGRFARLTLTSFWRAKVCLRHFGTSSLPFCAPNLSQTLNFITSASSLPFCAPNLSQAHFSCALCVKFASAFRWRAKFITSAFFHQNSKLNELLIFFSL